MLLLRSLRALLITPIVLNQQPSTLPGIIRPWNQNQWVKLKSGFGELKTTCYACFPPKIHLLPSTSQAGRRSTLHLLRFQLNLAVTKWTQPPLIGGRGSWLEPTVKAQRYLAYLFSVGYRVGSVSRHKFTASVAFSACPGSQNCTKLYGLSVTSASPPTSARPDMVYILRTPQSFPYSLASSGPGSRSCTCRLFSEDWGDIMWRKS